MSDFDLCLDILRRHDRERYLASLLLPPEARADITVLYAFNAEISRLREIVSEPMPGEIRLQWWRDALLGERKSEAMGHPLARALSQVIRQRDLPHAAFDTILTARTFDLYDDPIPTLAAFEAYAGETESLLFQLAALILGKASSDALADTSGHAGVAAGVAKVLRHFTRDAARGQLYLPLSILESHDLSREKVLNGEGGRALAAAMSEFASFGRMHREKAEAALARLPSSMKPVFLPLCLTEPIFSKVGKPGFDPLRDRVALSQIKAQWLLWRGFR